MCDLDRGGAAISTGNEPDLVRPNGGYTLIPLGLFRQEPVFLRSGHKVLPV